MCVCVLLPSRTRPHRYNFVPVQRCSFGKVVRGEREAASRSDVERPRDLLYLLCMCLRLCAIYIFYRVERESLFFFFSFSRIQYVRVCFVLFVAFNAYTSFVIAITVPQVSAVQKGPCLSVALAGHFMHGEHQRSLRFKNFLAQFPPWTVVTPWTASYTSWEF